MRKIIFALLSLFAFTPAFAATTWSADTSQDSTLVTVSKAVCTTGSESAPADGVGSPAVGLALFGVEGFSVYAEAAAAMTSGGTLQAYLYNPITTKWARAPDLDLVVSNLQYQAFPGFTVVADWARIAFVPVGVGQAVTVYVMGRRLPLILRQP